jgi:hypothetical protein
MSIQTHYIGDSCQGGHYHDARIADLERQLAEAQGKLDMAENFAAEQSREGKCLRCGAPIENHEEMSPSCWVLALACILSKEGE